MTPERKQEYKDSIDSALALLMDFRKALSQRPPSPDSIPTPSIL